MTNRKCRLTLAEAKAHLADPNCPPELWAACNTIVSLTATAEAYEQALTDEARQYGELLQAYNKMRAA